MLNTGLVWGMGLCDWGLGFGVGGLEFGGWGSDLQESRVERGDGILTQLPGSRPRFPNLWIRAHGLRSSDPIRSKEGKTYTILITMN